MLNFKWFKRKNAQAEIDKKNGTTKMNAEDVAVEVDGVKIPVAELEKEMLVTEAEEAEAKRKTAENDMEEVEMEDTFKASNGKDYKIGDMVANWKKRKANEGETAEEKEARENAEEEEKKEALNARANAVGLNEGASEEEIEEKENELEEEEKKNSLKKRANAVGLEDDASEEDIEKAEQKKNEESEDDDDETKEAKKNALKAGKSYFKELSTAQNSAVSTPVQTVGKSRAERASAWAKRNSNHKTK